MLIIVYFYFYLLCYQRSIYKIYQVINFIIYVYLIYTIHLIFYRVYGYEHRLTIRKVNNFPLYAVLITPFFCVEMSFIIICDSL